MLLSFLMPSCRSASGKLQEVIEHSPLRFADIASHRYISDVRFRLPVMPCDVSNCRVHGYVVCNSVIHAPQFLRCASVFCNLKFQIVQNI